MDRLQKKCFVASTGFHALLVVILIVGPAFIVSRNKAEDLPVLDFVPVKTVDSMLSGGGNPNASPPAAVAHPTPDVAPPPPPPPPKPAPQELSHHEERQPDPPKETVKPKEKVDPESLEIPKENKPRRPNITTTAVTRPKENDAEKKAREEAKEQERADAQAREDARRYADARRRAASAIGSAANNLDAARAGTTSIELKGPGGGGVPYANFLQAVKSVYERAWIVPDGVTDDNATVAVAVTIARDGTVVSSRVIRGSGDAAVDQSVRVTLRRVTFAAPLPDDAKESERTVNINFNVAAKRGAG